VLSLILERISHIFSDCGIGHILNPVLDKVKVDTSFDNEYEY
jgi:hypothetical protein